MCLAQGHNTVTLMRLEPATPWSQVKHFTTEPLCSQTNGLENIQYFKLCLFNPLPHSLETPLNTFANRTDPD